MSRAFILLLDSFGLGATPDAGKYGDAGANTFGHIASWAQDSGKPMQLPNLERLGLVEVFGRDDAVARRLRAQVDDGVLQWRAAKPARGALAARLVHI